ncbi:hypothetical protein LTR70_001673 [Exophiala xenobiotica]|uniref:Uncharacterized protein n=1 Tax=Lithohypha guttulata TaxID=1690604 RepID=A0ABR0KJ66_9EURO|nr:hypothetical protein LTR24_002565 [Lithohypha guttulata]KAK5327198.1 hypothetical protein LTR70_001673 [Exophiala xenobiotica]
MRPEDQKKVAAHYGALCGLRSDADSDSDDSTASRPSPKQEPATSAMSPPDKSILRPRPESLTLPFENRERESHLVSDEEFDRIIRQEELDNPLPPLPAGVDRGASGAGLRRSISTARNTRMSTMSQRLRPMSADFSRMVPNTAGQREQNTEPFPPLPRDPTLTALPRAPTRNDMMVYPAEANASTGRRQISSTTNHNRLQGRENEAHADHAQAQKKGHKRHFSAADMVDSMKKRVKRQNPHDSAYEQARAAISSPPGGSPAVSAKLEHESHPTSDRSDNNNPRSSSQSMEPARSQTDNAPESLKKSLLKRTWSKTKHAAKLPISSPGSKLKISEPLTTASSTTPLAHHGRDTPTPAPSTLTTGTNETSGYYASAEPSPQPSQRPFTPTPSNGSGGGGGLGPLQQSSYEYITGPAPRRGLMTKLGAPPSRNELNTMLARQQNRIVDLTLQNNVLVNQIELLRSEVQEMKVHNNAVGLNGRSGSAHGSHRWNPQSAHVLPLRGSPSRAESPQRIPIHGAELPLSEDEMEELSAGITTRTPRKGQGRQRQSFDPDGWRRIVGVRQEQEHDVDVDVDVDMDVNTDADTGGEGDIDTSKDDKRKTWMTCDS